MTEALAPQKIKIDYKANDSHESRAKWSFFAATHLAAQSMILQVISVPVMAYIIRNLKEYNYGQWSTATYLVGCVGILTNLGLRGTFVRAVARNPDSAQEILAEQFGIRLVLCVMATCIVMAVCWLVDYPATVVHCAAIACLGVFLNTIALTLADALQGLHRISVYANAQFVAGVALTAASVLAIRMDYGVEGLAVAYLSGPIVYATILIIYIHRRLFPIRARWSPRRFYHLLWDGRHFASQQITQTLSINQEALILPKLIGAESFGLFSGGLLLCSRLAIIPDSLGSALYPLVAQTYKRDPVAASRDVVKFFVLTLIITLPVAIGATIFSEAIANILFQKNVEICQIVIAVTIWAIPLGAVENVMNYALNAAGYDRQQSKITFISSIITLAMAIVLIWKLSILGACISILMRFINKIILVGPLFLRAFHPQLPVGRIVRVLVAGMLMAGCMEAARRLAPGHNLLSIHPRGLHGWTRMGIVICEVGFAGTIVYVLALFGLRVIEKQDLMQLMSRRARG